MFQLLETPVCIVGVKTINLISKKYKQNYYDKPFLEYPTDKMVFVGAAVVVAVIVEQVVVVLVELAPVLVQIPFLE